MVLHDAEYFRGSLKRVIKDWARTYLATVVEGMEGMEGELDTFAGSLAESILYTFTRVLVALCQTYKKGKFRKLKVSHKRQLDEGIEAGYPLSLYRLCS
jgi:hypothetical protein